MRGGGYGRLCGLATALAAALSILFPAVGGAATITPDVLSDDFTPNADCSLREAVQVANLDNAAIEDDCGVSGTLGDDTISLGAGTYQLGPGFAEDGTPDDNEQGDLDVNDPDGALTIDGQGAAMTTLNSSLIMAPVRPLNAVGGPALTIEDMTVTGGHPSGLSNGGGILSSPSVSLTLLRSMVTGNSANYGGGVLANGPLTVTDSSLTTNVAAANGGAIYPANALTVNGTSAITGNDAENGAGIHAGTGTKLTISGSVTISGNDAASTGGGVYIVSMGSSPSI